MALGLVIVKAVGNQCNLQCRYCYVNSEEKQNFMLVQTFEQVVKSVAALDHLPIFFWGGGEPLLAGRKFFKKALALQANYCGGRSFINSLQTNGILLDPVWINFFKKHNFQVGISWDGIEGFSRVTKGGQAVTKRIWKVMELALKEGLNFGVITVITKENIKQLPEIAEMLYSKGVKNLLLKPYVGSIRDLSVDSSTYVEAMIPLLDLWLEKDDCAWVIEPLCSFQKALGDDWNGIGCGLINNCGDFLTIEYDGKVTCCDFVSQRFIFGDIHEQDIKDILNGPAYQQFVIRAGRRPEKCLKCQWQYLCGGGCLHYRNFDEQAREWGKYILCKATKRFFDYCEQKIH